MLNVHGSSASSDLVSIGGKSTVQTKAALAHSRACKVRGLGRTGMAAVAICENFSITPPLILLILVLHGAPL